MKQGIIQHVVVPKNCVQAFLCVFFASVALLTGSDSVVDIGTRPELFVDYFLIDRLEGTNLKLHPPVRAEIAIRFDEEECGLVFFEGMDL